MLALIFGLAASAGWIAFDVWASIVTYPQLPHSEWLLFVTIGAVLVICTIVAEILVYKESKKAEGRQTHDHDVLAQGNIAVLEGLARVTQTIGQPDGTVVEAAILKIETLEKAIGELRAGARHVTSAQLWLFGQALPRILPELFERPPRFDFRGVRIIYGSTIEAQSYAEELSQLFGGHAITVTMVKEITFESLNRSGLRVLVADSAKPTINDKLTMELLDAAKIEYVVEVRATEFPLITTLRVGRMAR